MIRHREACEKVVELAPTSQAYADPTRAVAGVDECANNQEIWMMLREAIRAGKLSMSTPLWHEIRATADGGRISTRGSTPTQNWNGIDFGRRIEGDSYSDAEVVSFATAHLYMYRRLLIISNNRRRDAEGLRSILNRDIAPVLNGSSEHGLSLLFMLKQPATSNSAFSRKIGEIIADEEYPIGFTEHRI